METFTPAQIYCQIFLFKSYYVVWKRRNHLYRKKSRGSLNRTMQYGNLETISILNAHTERFKSYYVVWKRSRNRHSHCTLRRFKSYYVVWKLDILFFFPCGFCGLNRTMQYGNIQRFLWKKKHTHRLNRTMQYGNSYVLCHISSTFRV